MTAQETASMIRNTLALCYVSQPFDIEVVRDGTAPAYVTVDWTSGPAADEVADMAGHVDTVILYTRHDRLGRESKQQQKDITDDRYVH